MSNPSPFTASRQGKSSSPLKRSSSIRNTLTSILGSSSSHKNNQNSSDGNKSDTRPATASLRRHATASGPPSSRSSQAPRRRPTRTGTVINGNSSSSNRMNPEPRRSRTVSDKPKIVKRPSNTSGSRSSSFASSSSSTGSGSTPMSSQRSLQRSASTASSKPRSNGDSKTSLNAGTRTNTKNGIFSGTRNVSERQTEKRPSAQLFSQQQVPASVPERVIDSPLEDDEVYSPDPLMPPSQIGVSAAPPPPPPSAKEFLIEYLTQRGLLRPKTIYERPELKISLSSSGDHVFLPTMSCNDDEYLARLNGFREDEDFEILDSAESRENNSRDDGIIEEGSFRPASNGNLRPRSSAISFRDNNPFRQPSRNAQSPPPLEMDESMAPLTIAVIVSIPKHTEISTVETQLCSLVRIHWYAGVPPTRSFQEENYNAGTLNWSLGTDNMNVFIPLNVSSKEKIIENNRNIRQMSLFRNNVDGERIYLERGRIRRDLIKEATGKKPQTMQPGDYVYIIPTAFHNHIPESLYLPSARVHYRFCIATRMQDGESRSLSPQQQKAIEEERQQEAEINSHKKFGILKKIKGNHSPNGLSPTRNTSEDPNEVYTEYPIYVIRTPPPISISTANKPIYIDRVWTDSLTYEVSFGQKYVALGSKVPVTIKLQPLSPDVFVKRVRISIVERITFVSKNCEFEYDQVDPVARDPYNPYFHEFSSKRKKERSLSLLEVRSRDKGARAIKEEIIENCVDDNLLSYNTDGSTDPLHIETNLDFPCYEDLDKNTAKQVPPYGVDAYANIPNPEAANASFSGHHGLQQSSNNNTPTRRSSVMGFLANRKSSLSPASKNNSSDSRRKSSSSQPSYNQSRSPQDPRFHETKLKSGRGITVKKHTRLNKPRRGLYLDSLHFTNIHSRHKLEVMLRISKPDSIDPTKMRHYEVLIDTPIFLISEKCSEGNMELPTYSDAVNDPLAPSRPQNLIAPPTFEEAISVPASPIQSPLASPLGSPSASPTASPLASPMGSPRRRSDHLPQLDSDIQHLSLGSTPNLVPPENQLHTQPSSAPEVNPKFADSDHMFNNLDKLMSSPTSNGDKSYVPKFCADKHQGIDRAFGSDDLDMTRPTFYEKDSEEGPTSERPKKGFSSEPPKYDEIVH